MVRGTECFPKAARLRRRSEYRLLQQHGRTLHTPHLLLFVLERPGEESRLGITVSRRVGNAVVRNRLKRYVREAYRRHRAEFPPGKALVVLVKRADDLDAAAVTAELLRARKRL